MGNTAESSICGPVYSNADVIVSGGWDIFHSYAQEAYSLAISHINDLASVTFADIPIELSYAFPDGTSTFVPPVAPTRTIGAFVVPDLPDLPDISTPVFDTSLVGPLPDAPTDLPVYTTPARPDASIPDAPDTTVVLDVLTVPDAPVYVLPEVPSFISLNLPVPPEFTLPTFAGVRPDITSLVAPQNDFNFTEQEYSSDLLDQVKASLMTMSQGGTGLPAAVEQALFDRARGREDQLTAVEVSTALDEWTRLGYEEPSGVLNNRIERIRQRAQDKQLTLSRDIYIQAQTVQIETLRFAVTQGIALEQVLIQQHMAVQERALRFAQLTVQMSIEIFNAEIARENLGMQLYTADAQVYRDQIQAEIAKADLYKTQLEGELAKGQINEQSIRLYEAQLQGIRTMEEIYKTTVDAIVAKGQLNAQRLDEKRLLVQTYSEQVNAYTAVWQGFNAQVEGELGNLKAAQMATDRFATLTSAWQTQNNVAVARLGASISTENLKLQQGAQLMQTFLGQIQAESARVDGESKALGAEASVYSAAGEVAQANSAAQDRALQTQIAEINADAQLQLKRADLAINSSIQQAGLLIESMKSMGNTAAQLAAAAMSAVNLSATLSSASANSSSCSQSFNFSGELS